LPWRAESGAKALNQRRGVLTAVLFVHSDYSKIYSIDVYESTKLFDEIIFFSCGEISFGATTAVDENITTSGRKLFQEFRAQYFQCVSV
jgi:hypothetical protein